MRRPLAVMLALVLAASTWIGLGAVAASELGPPPAFEGVLEGTAPPPSHLEAAPAIGAAVVNTASRSDVVAFFTSTYMASQGIATDWTGNHAACVAGATSAAYADATLLRVAYFRAMAGVPASIVLDGSLSAKAQSAALMMSAQGALSHNPSPSFTCYSAGGAEAARRSNLALGVTGPDAVSLYMDDPGAGNYFVGHRRWVLHPPQATMGTGSVPAASGKPAANALWVLAPFGPRPSLPDGVAWPPRGFVPYQAMPTTSNRWSFSYPGADFSHASVTMTRGGATVPVTIEAKVNDQGYGDNTLVWRPQEYTAGRPAVDTTYSVAIGNAVIEGAARSFAYEVTVIDPAAPPPPPAVFAAVLPSSRSVQVGTPATAFATMINAGTTSLTGCRISLATSIPAELMYQTTNAVTNVVTGTPNTPVTIPPGGSQSFVIVITPTAAIAPVEVALGFRCDGDVSAPVTNGVNTLLLSASTTPVPDVIALAATPSADGIVRIAGPGATGAFAVATSNVGEEASVTVIADTGGTPLPLTIGICETHPATGACQTATAPSLTTLIGPGATPTFAVFVTPTGPVPFDPASHRIFVRFQHAGATRGSTSVAVMSVPPSYALALLTAGTGSGTATGGGSYAPGATVTLSASPGPGSTFAGWSGDVDCGDGSVSVGENLTCVATFLPVPPALPPPPPVAGPASTPFSDMPANTWRRASPAGRAVYQSAVHPSDPAQPDSCARTISSPNPVTRTYSGLAAGGGKVFNWGGGHGSHPGNDVDLYDPSVNAWAVQLPPECPVNGSTIAQAIAGSGGAVTTVTPAGRPYTQHSYRQCAYDSVRGRFLCVVASGTWAYDVAARTWTRLAVSAVSPQWFLGYGGVVYDWAADRLIAFVTSPAGSTGRGVHVFNPATNLWTFRGAFPVTFADVTPVAAYIGDTQEIVVHLGGFGLWRYALGTGIWRQVTTVPNVIKSVEANFDYDTLNRRVVFLVTPLAGVRSTAVWAWDPVADGWQAMPAPPVAPAAYLYASGSERGHFVYEARSNVFIYVESATLYCTLGGAWSCGGLTETWAYRYAAPTSPAAFSIPITVTEPGAGAAVPAAIPRSRDGVTGGVPVPAAFLDGPWTLMDGAVEIPLQVTRLRGSWLLLDFQADVAGWGSKVFSLVPVPASVSHPSPVVVSEDATGATISTGPLTLSVQRDLSPFSLQYVDHAGTVFGAQAPTVWSWEVRGPIRSTLRMDGVFASGLGYTLRLTFRAGHNDVTAQVTLRNSRGTGYRSEKVRSATLAYGVGTTVRSGGFGTMTYVPCAAGCAFEVLPAFVYADTTANGGVVIPDMSHWGADARLDFDGGLSADEVTRRARSAIYPLVPLASADTYAAEGLTAQFSTLQDERDANAKWGWAWTAAQEPTVPHRAYPAVTWLYVDVHGDTEADDTWQNAVMYVRTGTRGYWDRARSWARYTAWQYTPRTDGWTYGTARVKGAEPPLTAADHAYLLTAADGRLDIDAWLADHFYGWGVLDWYLLSGDAVALEAAGDLLEASRKQWGALPGYTFVYGLRNIARHLLFTVRYVEITGDAVARAHADHLAMLLLTTASWDESWGMYVWANSSPTRPKAVSPFHVAILHHAFERYWMLTGNAEVRRRMLRMSDFALAHGLHPAFRVGVYEVAVDYPATGQVWHGGFTAASPVNPHYSAVWIDMLVRAWAMTGEGKYLDRAVLHWEKASKITYGALHNQPNAGPTQTGKYTGFLNQRLGTCCSAPDSIYFELNGFLPYAHRLHRAVVRPPAS